MEIPYALLPKRQSHVGEFQHGQKHGLGTDTLANGDEYVGEFDHGIKQGQGTFTFGEGEFEGEKFVGEFKDEEWWNGTVYDSEGNALETYSEGKPR